MISEFIIKYYSLPLVTKIFPVIIISMRINVYLILDVKKTTNTVGGINYLACEIFVKQYCYHVQYIVDNIYQITLLLRTMKT